MNRTWEFSDIEFFVLWKSVGRGGLPFPLYYLGRTEDPERFKAELLAAREEVDRRLGRSFDPILATIADPDLRIVVNGGDGRAPREPEGLVRLIGARRQSSGYLLKQLPGESYWHSGGFTVTECEAVGLADSVVAEMPEAEPGKQRDVVLPAESPGDELDHAYGGSAVHDSFDDSTAQRGAAFLATPAPSYGTIDVVQGFSIFGPRGITKHRLRWRDLEGDGRYVIGDETPPVARPADRKHLTNTINTRVAAVIRAIKDERA
ncbi:ESX secretion-associated protein EspG [Nocardia cyriacigeorgica]|uniref:ESX secretion-associated protein EspG n=1 Tax=Nocardia cyriacigeorgica TaxID=135487 RepID=A0A6P1DEE7_9NOCA|nr:ESX secretion-associated protein EspG [Nocardia cyriacigeorgica]NEW39049.1 ESX secretion-associated protein EspG [Nocardia cyriacigeorgica]NEW47524.1 ESX secretion-associated protein EspG [Nocardia cyriacigeorgica]NEW52685.1 ESX secretion-associated protein EspG [Nocardia cyriacigeorgica]NEW57386.1 ESX secretion-associated protein EspG [Nocardia cyriacigeorgica]